MAGVDTIPDLTYQKPDGSLFSRLEMEEQMRAVWPKIHWIRLKANKIYSLPRQAAFDMREVTLRHWTLDEMIRRGQVTGDTSGVDTQTYNDEASTRQFIQRLQYLVQSGQAKTPQEGEGIDMSQFVPPPPPMGAPPLTAPAQQPMQYQPPSPQGYAPPMPAGMPQTPPQPSGPPQPPGPPQQMQLPMMPPQGMPAGAPQYAPPMPGGGMPQMPSTPVPPMPGAPPPMMPQQQPQGAPQGGGRGRKRGDQQQAQPPGPPQASPVPPMPQQGYAPPNQFGPPGTPPMMPQAPGGQQQGYAQPSAPQQQVFSPPPTQQVPVAAPAATDPAIHQKLDQILANQQQIIAGQTRLSGEWTVIQAGLATWVRVTYQMKPGAPDLKATLMELGIQFPQ